MSPMMGSTMQESAGAGCTCMRDMHDMMMGPMGWTWMILAALIAIAAIVALVSVSIFLVRRSHTPVA